MRRDGQLGVDIGAVAFVNGFTSEEKEVGPGLEPRPSEDPRARHLDTVAEHDGGSAGVRFAVVLCPPARG